MGILDKISCPVCGGMGAQIRNKLGRVSSTLEYTRTLACKHCDAELDDPETYIRESLKEDKGKGNFREGT